MASYKVPQDVEADDKLIGPFSFRQFVYLIIVALAGGLAWALAQVFVGLAIIPLPIILLFGALALPLRKDQPMEIYLAAIVSFYLKPRQRLWDAEGVESNIEISAPKVVEVHRAKDLSQTEAEQRLSYLANIVDSQGWAIRGVAGATGTAMNNDIYLEAQGVEDVLDTNTSTAHAFSEMMDASTERARDEAKQRMVQAAAQVPQQPQPQLVQPQPDPATPAPQFNPYPNIQQSVIQPLGNSAYHAEVPEEEEKPATTSDTALTAGIINLANNPDLSIETIAHEAQRLTKKAEEESEEVVISLR